MPHKWKGRELYRKLPHRDEMLLLDELWLEDDGSVTATHTFKADEWFFKGHFPGMPVVPGAVTCEIMAQSCCGLLLNDWEGKVPYLVKINEASFHKKMVAGDCVKIISRLTCGKLPLLQAYCRAFVEGKLCAQAYLTFVVRDKGL